MSMQLNCQSTVIGVIRLVKQLRGGEVYYSLVLIRLLKCASQSTTNKQGGMHNDACKKYMYE